MRATLTALFVAAGTALACASSPSAPSDATAPVGQAPVEAGFVALFNGRDFDGWTGAVDGYEVRDGAIVCRSGQGGTLYTRRTFRNFVVRLEFRLPPAGNNGRECASAMNKKGSCPEKKEAGEAGNPWGRYAGRTRKVGQAAWPVRPREGAFWERLPSRLP